MTEYGIRFGFCSSARALKLSNSPPVGNFSTSTAAGDGDCLILDLHMPEMSGIELLEEMRQRGKTLPAILISGRLDVDSALAGLVQEAVPPDVRRGSGG